MEEKKVKSFMRSCAAALAAALLSIPARAELVDVSGTVYNFDTATHQY
jgi:hypothetical protein